MISKARLRLTIGGTPSSVSARHLLLIHGTDEPEYWLKGGIASEFIVRDWAENVAGQLNVSYRVRVYPSAGAIRVSTVVENCWINGRGNISYDLALDLGRSVPVTVFQKTGLEHFQSARWHMVFWQGATPPTIETRYNLAYMIKGRRPDQLRHLACRASCDDHRRVQLLEQLRPRHHGWRVSDQVLPDHWRPQ